MNRSGFAVRYLVEYHQPEIRNLLIIHDDLDLEVGRFRIVRGGGAGGHHGVESVILHLRTREFNRMKIGIGRPRHDEPIEDFVLSPPYEDQQNSINDVLHVVVNAIELFVIDGVESAMNKFNSPAVGKKEVEE